MTARILISATALLMAGGIVTTMLVLHARTNTPEYRAAISYLSGAEDGEEAASLGFAESPAPFDDANKDEDGEPVSPYSSVQRVVRRAPAEQPQQPDLTDTQTAETSAPEAADTEQLDRAERASPTPQTVDDTATIREIQTFLKERAYYTGAVDGIAGPNTRAAIRAFEADLGWNQTGRIRSDLLIAVRNRANPQRASDAPNVGMPVNLIR